MIAAPGDEAWFTDDQIQFLSEPVRIFPGSIIKIWLPRARFTQKSPFANHQDDRLAVNNQYGIEDEDVES
jgi:hypothetical protein